MAKDSTSTNHEKFILRMPLGLRERVALAASENHRSMNAQIVSMLEALLMPSSSKRLQFIIDCIALDEKRSPFTVEKLAEGIGEKSPARLREILSGAAEADFEVLARIADFLFISDAWLKFGDGAPFIYHDIGFVSEDALDDIYTQDTQKLFFVRADTTEGQLAIIRQLDGFRCETLNTRIYVSEIVGDAGYDYLVNFAAFCRKMWKDTRRQQCIGLQLNGEDFQNLAGGHMHGLEAVRRGRQTHWLDDWWDEHMYNSRNEFDEYWSGYTNLCRTVGQKTKILGNANLA